MVFIICFSMSNGEKMIFLFEVSDEGHSSFGFRNIEVFFKLIVLILQKHRDLIALLFLKVGLFFRAIRGRVAILAANSTFDVDGTFGLEGTGPSTMTFLLAVLTVIFIDSLNLLIITVQEFFHFLIFIPI